MDWSYSSNEQCRSFRIIDKETGLKPGFETSHNAEIPRYDKSTNKFLRYLRNSVQIKLKHLKSSNEALELLFLTFFAIYKINKLRGVGQTIEKHRRQVFKINLDDVTENPK